MEGTGGGDNGARTHGEASAREVAEGLARAFGGSILFALPLLMTMEMWWLGFYMSPLRLVALLVTFFPILIGLSHYIGFDETATIGHSAVQATIAYGVALVSSGVMLSVIGVFKPDMGWHEVVGKLAVQAGPGALGALLAQSHFGSSPEKEQRREDAAYTEHLFFMLVGALYVALTVAPTDEMPLIGFMMHDAHTLAAVALSLLLLHFFMQGVGFEGHAAAAPGGALSTFLRLSVVGYALALIVSAFLLYVFGRFDGSDLAAGLHTTIALALPATAGAGAARLTLDA
jgi:putative integral membrane protein (TIGR02587 family)